MTANIVVVGGGLYGCATALHLRRKGAKVTLLERENALFRRASRWNQARIHRGYHYPRSVATATSCARNFDRFCREYAGAVRRGFSAIYAVAAQGSRVTRRQFESFAERVGIPLHPAPKDIAELFDTELVEAAYLVDEPVLDADALATQFKRELENEAVDVRCALEATAIERDGDRLRVRTASGALAADFVFHCGYAAFNGLASSVDPEAGLKQEIAEIAYVDPGPSLRNVGITLMDGPFFSLLPFPPLGLTSFTHVRYTRRGSWIDTGGPEATARLAFSPPKRSNFPLMVGDAVRYVPTLKECRWFESRYELRTILERSTTDDGRPILLRRDPSHPRVFSVLGSKLDNVFDYLGVLDGILESDPVWHRTAKVA